MTTEVRLGARHAGEGEPLEFAELVRSVYAGDADPADYIVEIAAAEDSSDS